MRRRKGCGGTNALIFIGSVCLTLGFGRTEQHHRTKAATEKQNDLWCYRCDSMFDGENCQDLRENATHMHMKCNKEHKKCQVSRISVSTSTKDTVGKPKLWLLRRNCSETCEPGCIIIGERTKLHSCITCCEHSFCNSGSSAESAKPFSGVLLFLCAIAPVYLSKSVFRSLECAAVD